MSQVWVKGGRTVDWDVRKRSGADGACAVVVLPFVKVMSKGMVSDLVVWKEGKIPT